MSDEIGVVDLFAGPGGLGEGFSAAGRESGRGMAIRVSVECDPAALETLRLRSFLRTFEGSYPKAYYDAIHDGGTMPDWAERHPMAWRRALDEVWGLRLGSEGAFSALAPRLDRIREQHHGHTILIGGPPCQAYSIVGRSRNRAKSGYVPEEDHRHFLYKEYVAILDRLRPAAFVMENVKGLLSSTVGGGRIVERVIDDLETAGDGYRLLPLASASSGLWQPSAKDFLVAAEEHGIPQTRHRLFMVGVRNDIAPNGKLLSALLAQRSRSAVTVNAAVGDLPVLRSGLSVGDSQEEWRFQVRRIARMIAVDPATPSDVAFEIDQLLSCGLGDLGARAGTRYGQSSGLDEMPELAAWLRDERLATISHHETRSHIAGDLGRYLYAATYGRMRGRSPRLHEFPTLLQPDHANRGENIFKDRFRVQLGDRPSGTITSHIAKDGHYFIHPDPLQCRSFTVREAARIQTFPDNYIFRGNRTQQYHQVGNAVPPFLALQIARCLRDLLAGTAVMARTALDQLPRAAGFA